MAARLTRQSDYPLYLFRNGTDAGSASQGLMYRRTRLFTDALALLLLDRSVSAVPDARRRSFLTEYKNTAVYTAAFYFFGF